MWGFAIWTAVIFLSVLVLVTALGLKVGGAEAAFRSDRLDQLTIPNLASLASSTVSAVLVTVGIVRMRRGDRVGGYRMLGRAMLIQIFITQTFIFVESSFSAITGLLGSILLLIVIRFSEHHEAELLEQGSAQAPLPPPAAPARGTGAIATGAH